MQYFATSVMFKRIVERDVHVKLGVGLLYWVAWVTVTVNDPSSAAINSHNARNDL